MVRTAKPPIASPRSSAGFVFDWASSPSRDVALVTRGRALLSEADELDIEQERFVRGNEIPPGPAICKRWRNDQAPASADANADQALIPTRNDLPSAQTKLERRQVRIRCIELRAFEVRLRGIIKPAGVA